ncbi:HYR domain-containing protein [Actinacidiphila acididurans]|uniref:HYR domain-containing protein n=1 Tax=Actinacidiphila acididurans TaxID=2784346 RepID=A0ABS2TV74_9ACTN|nr:HYR domain-containing protein [Actinacidiphila acididurans]MBM9506707.1 HYR domain-containing protein [Actinacidiphila acididurans]
MRRVQRFGAREAAARAPRAAGRAGRVVRLGTAAAALLLAVGIVPGVAAGPRPDAAAQPVTPALVDQALAPGGSLQVTKTVATPVIPPRPDVVLLVDGTNSMGEVIGNVQTYLGDITTKVRQEQPDSRFAVATFGDITDGDARVFTVLQGLTYDLTAVQKGVNQLRTDRGLGSPGPSEDWINALWQIANGSGGETAFRPGASPVVVLVSDASSHDPSNGHTLGDATAALNAAGARVLALDVATSIGDGLNGSGGPYKNTADKTAAADPPVEDENHEPNEATTVVNATNGKLFERIDAAQVADTIAQGLANLPTAVTHQTLGCDPALGVTLDPASRTVTSGTAATFTETIGVAPDAPQGAELTCVVQFLLDGKVPDAAAPDVVAQDAVSRRTRPVRTGTYDPAASTAADPGSTVADPGTGEAGGTDRTGVPPSARAAGFGDQSCGWGAIAGLAGGLVGGSGGGLVAGAVGGLIGGTDDCGSGTGTGTGPGTASGDASGGPGGGIGLLGGTGAGPGTAAGDSQGGSPGTTQGGAAQGTTEGPGGPPGTTAGTTSGPTPGPTTGTTAGAPGGTPGGPGAPPGTDLPTPANPYQEIIGIAVRDVTAPVVTLDSRAVQAAGPSGTRITYTATAQDAVDGPLPVTCAPPSGTLFPLGTTKVTCTATDAAGNTGSATAAFTVLPAPVPDQADLAVRISVAPTPAYTGAGTYARITVTNTGPRTATGVVVSTAWPRPAGSGASSVGSLPACTAAAPCDVPPGGRLTLLQQAVYHVALTGTVRVSVHGAPRDPRTGDNSASARIRVLRPVLTVAPDVVKPGDVVLARGRDFPPGTVVPLSWSRGITASSTPVVVAPDGTFEAQVLVVAKDVLGPRDLRARPAGLDPPSRPVLVVQPSVQPPDFAGRG